ncbi:MAG: hypothetical protein KF819_07230 [Labilithrix sp.]|nr:hypothetical protein [Labilithrix sp.]
MALRAALSLVPLVTLAVSCTLTTSLDGLSSSSPDDAPNAGEGECGPGGGACDAAKECPPSWLLCGGACVDPTTDPKHCGGCEQACASTCSGGTCAAAGPPATLVQTPPVTVSGGASCTITDPAVGRRVAVDAGNYLYVLMDCGGTANVATSADGGKSWGAPVPLDAPVGLLAVQGAASGVAYVAAWSAARGIIVSKTSDAGKSWSSTRIADVADNWIGLAASGDQVYVAARAGMGVDVFRSTGGTSFAKTTIAGAVQYGDVFVDPADASVWVGGDTPSLVIHRSTDGAQTFGPPSSPPGTLRFSDWSVGGGAIFAAGQETTMRRIPTATPGTSTAIGGLPTGPNRGRSLAAAPGGAVFIATETTTSGVTLHRIAPGAMSLEPERALAPAGKAPAVVAASDSIVFVAYAEGTSVMGTVQQF